MPSATKVMMASSGMEDYFRGSTRLAGEASMRAKW